MNLKNFILLVVSLYLLACAQRGVLTGGDKDILPPEVKKTTPENQSLQFTEKLITVEFDEFIRLDNVQSQLIVSPLMETAPEIVLRGKKLVIKINDELAPNTTYSLNFGDAIKDITEGNIYPNYKYVFSTGDFIDSLSYSGTVVDAFTLLPQENIFVMLYDQLEDSIPFTQKPRYIAKSNKEGHFSITNIAAGTYQLFALNDVNSNYLFDLPNEQIGFYSESVQIDSSSNDHQINMFTETNELQYVVSIQNPTYGQLDIKMNMPANGIEVKLEEELELEEKNEQEKLKTYWMKHPIVQEEVAIVVYENDSPIDTSSVNVITQQELTDTALSITTNVRPSFDLNQHIELSFGRPIKAVDTSKIQLLEDSIAVAFTLNQDSLTTRKQHIQYDFKEKTDYVLFIQPEAFTDIYELKNDSVLQPFKTKKESNYGKLLLNISPSFNDDFLVQIFLKDQLTAEKTGKGKSNLVFNYLLPGEYMVKLMVDGNQNKKWDTGKYLEKIQPEKVIFYEGTITIQENWDNKIEWVIAP